MKTFFTSIGLCLAIFCTGQVPERFKDTTRSREVPQYTPEELAGDKPAREGEQKKAGESDPKLWDRMLFGGNLGLSVGSYTFISVAPAMGYRITDRLVGGTGFIYRYFKWNQAFNPNTGQLQAVEDYGNQIYGPKFFMQYFPADMIFLGTQFEYLNHNVLLYQNQGPAIEDNRWTPVLFLEGGLKQSLGRKGYAVVGLRINVLHDLTSPYATSWMPMVGFFF